MGTKFILGQEDGTIAGGDPRGANAVDLQTSRTVATQVSSGEFSSILGGLNNRNLAPVSFIGGGNTNFINGSVGSSYQNKVIVGGSDNQISNVATRNTFIGGGYGNNINGASEGGSILGGYQNTLSGSQTVISGGQGNTVSSNHSTVSGGQSNTASIGSHATVVGGQTNTSSGQWAISGGQSSTASANRTISLGTSAVANAVGAIAISAGAGNQTTASGISSVSIGNDTLASGRNSLCTGYFSNAYLYGQKAHSGNFIGGAVAGNCQYSELNPFKLDTLTTGGTTVLSLDGTGTTNLIIPNGNNRMWNVQIDTIAVVTTITGTATGVTVGDAYRETKQLLFKRVGGTSSIVGTVDTTAVKNDTSMSTASLVVTAGASQEMALTFAAPTFSGGGSVTCRVVARIQLVEVAY